MFSWSHTEKCCIQIWQGVPFSDSAYQHNLKHIIQSVSEINAFLQMGNGEYTQNLVRFYIALFQQFS